jgi:phosphate acyltransferase
MCYTTAQQNNLKEIHHMKIALDAMGGDRAPEETVKGAIEAVQEYGVEVLLVGQKDALEAELAKHKTSDLPLRVIDAPDIVEMDEEPVKAVRRKPNASMVVAARLAKSEADAMVTAGNSGAAMAACLFQLGRIEGIERPAFGGVIPTYTGGSLLIDIGANVECRPVHLLQFALMGSVYMQKVYGLPSPRVGLLSNGEEESKGTSLVKEAHALLKQAPINFTGNIESRDVPFGHVDVIVTDGFTGNAILKMGEGVVYMMLKMIKDELTKDFLTKLAAAPLRPSFDHVRARLDVAEYGGAPILGVNGVGVIAHGRSDAKAIKNAIHAAKQAVEYGTVEAIRSVTEATMELTKEGVKGR